MDLSWLGGLFGSAGNLLGQYMNVGYQKELQENQFKLNKKAYKYSLRHGPEQTRHGLEVAGYNPLLATNASMGSNGFSVSPANAPNTSDLGTDAVNAYQNSQRIKNEQKTTDATVDNLGSQTLANNAEANYKNQLSLSEEIKRAGFELDNSIKYWQNEQEKFKVGTQEYKFAQEMEEMASRTKLNIEQAKFTGYNALSNRINANAMATNAQTGIERLGVDYELGKETNANQAERNQIERENNIIRNTLIGIGSLAIPGFGVAKGLKGAYKSGQLINKYKKFKNSADYYKNFSTTIVH